MMLTARKKTRIAWWAGLFLVPSLLLYASLVIVPIGVAMVLSLFDWDGSGPMEFIGLGNWATFVSDSDAMAAMQRTGVLVAASWLVQVPLAMTLGIYASGKARHRVVLSSVYFIPALMSAAAMGVLWGQLFSPVGGGISYAADNFGLFFLSPDWLGDPKLVMATIIALVAWQFVPFHALLFQAGVSQIPRSIYEAASIDGVSGLKRFWYVTLPMLRHTIVTSSILNIVGSLTIFDLIYVLTPNSSATKTMSVIARENLFEFDKFAYGSAESTLLFLLIAILTVLYIWLGRVNLSGGDR